MGTARWLAPELLAENANPSKESDIYAFACVCYEIFTGLLPFHQFKNDAAVVLQVIAGTRPSRTEALSAFPDALWSTMEGCWDANPSLRPSASAILLGVTAMRATSITPAPGWDDFAANDVWNNLDHSTSVRRKPASMIPLQRNSSDDQVFDRHASHLHVRWIRDERKKKRKALNGAGQAGQRGEETTFPKFTNLPRPLARFHDQRAEHSDSSGSYSEGYASTSSSILSRYFPKRFFVLKSSSEARLFTWMHQTSRADDKPAG
ncbi:Rho guanine nucleotide exchange factor [Marasmius crinis-equi]|uniref:Rho guanine nucleotide exchange factor n=1 Tax=Marasmius crinis-equi TaxID=585013 RepID=A0ABR3F0X7_9AGAR